MKAFSRIMIQLPVYVMEIGFLYIWLKAFLKRKELHFGIVSAVFTGFLVIRCLTSGMENVVFGMLLGLTCSFAFSVLLFQDQIEKALFYVITGYVFEIAVEILLEWAVDLAGVRWVSTGTFTLLSALPALIQAGLLFLIYYVVIIKFTIQSADEAALQNPFQYGILFYPVPIATCFLLIVIRAFGVSNIQGAWSNALLIIGILVSVIANAAAVYLLEKGIEMKTRVQKLEREQLRFRLEEKNYRNMEKLHEEYDVFLHDIKHTMRTIAALAREGNCEEIENIITDMRTSVGRIEQEVICSDPLLNALLSERKGYANDSGVIFDVEIREPLYFQEMEELDLIVLLGNLLDNAIEAERRSKKREGVLCHMRMAREGRHMIIQVENSYDEKEQSQTRKVINNVRIGEKHGIGLESVRASVRKYGGIMENEKEKGRYCVKVILPVMAEWEEGMTDSVREITVMD